MLLFSLAPAARAQVAPIAPSGSGDAWTGDEVAKLDADLDAFLAGAPGVRGAHVGVLAIDTRTGATLYARAADDAFQPASTLKLLVGSAALEKLGGDYRFTTAAYATGPIIGGVLQGKLVVRGGGDPTLTRRELAELAPVVAQTVRRIRDGVAADETRYDRRPYPAGWVWDDFGEDYAPVVSPLTVDGNVRDFIVRPGDAVGSPVRLSLENRTFTQIGVCSDPNFGLDVVARTAPPSAPSTLDVERILGGCAALVGAKSLGSGPETVAVADLDPTMQAGERAVTALQAAGVDVRPWSSGAASISQEQRSVAGADPILWSHRSRRLAELLGPDFWIPSDNLFAELLLKELGLAAAGAPGTTDKGTAFERAWLRAIGVDPATTTLADGSGLSQYDRITPRDLVAILQHDWNGPNRQLVLDSLPVGGARGTIEGIAGTAAAGRVFAKTGSMSHVRGLAGFLATQRHGAVTFAFMVDDWLGQYDALAALRARVLSRIVTD